MKLITFQSKEALKSLMEKGYLECNPNNIDMDKVGCSYNWIVENMNKCIENPYKTKYPLWCWVKCYNGICPPKRKGKKVSGFDVKITFNKDKKDIFITDFRRYSFLLNNIYLPKDINDKEIFDKKLLKYNITNEDLLAYVRKDKYNKHRTDKEYLDICNEIRDSFKRCISEDSNILQGCIWRINFDEIDNIEIIKDDGYVYGSLNYLRANNERFDWIKDYYRKLK